MTDSPYPTLTGKQRFLSAAHKHAKWDALVSALSERPLHGARFRKSFAMPDVLTYGKTQIQSKTPIITIFTK